MWLTSGTGRGRGAGALTPVFQRNQATHRNQRADNRNRRQVPAASRCILSYRSNLADLSPAEWSRDAQTLLACSSRVPLVFFIRYTETAGIGA